MRSKRPAADPDYLRISSKPIYIRRLLQLIDQVKDKKEPMP